MHGLPHFTNTRGGDRTRRTGNGQAVTAGEGDRTQPQARQEHARPRDIAKLASIAVHAVHGYNTSKRFTSYACSDLVELSVLITEGKLTTCKQITKSGKRCQAQPKAGSDLCFMHSPKYAAARAQARRKGGQVHKTPHGADPAIIPNEINNLDHAKQILVYALAELAPMDNSLQRVRAYLALFDSFVKALEIGELENRIAALEAKP